ncbi:MAG: DMT family transporter [Ectothiorhodospiraceae bacterium]|nr:DMT family transporter [Ectothiorhodospiraceae bacterium]
MSAPSPHTRGFLLTLAGVLVLTPDTLLVRLLDGDPFTVTTCRGLLSGITILLGFAWARGPRAIDETRALGVSGVAVGVLYAINAVFFVLALHHTSVANTLVILATTPLIAASMSFFVLRERASPATWAAIVAALVGITVVVWDGLGRGTARGDAYALVTAASLAASLVVIRRRRDLNMVPATGLGALLSGLVMLPMSGIGALSLEQVGYALAMGVVVLPVAFAALTLGPRTVPAPEVALLLLLETVLGPLWVWLGVGERPGTAALVGGAIVVGTLVVHSAWRLRPGATMAPNR